MTAPHRIAAGALFGIILISRCAVSAEAPQLSVGDQAPDCELIGEMGQTFHLREWRGQTFAITFIFTRCPLADYCPLLASRFFAVHRELSQKKESSKKWRLLSLTFDPEHDTPDKLRDYGKAHGADAARWTFATGKPGVVAAFGAHFGLTAYLQDGFLNHNLRTVVIDPTGRVQHIFAGNGWTPGELLWEMRKAMAE